MKNKNNFLFSSLDVERYLRTIDILTTDEASDGILRRVRSPVKKAHRTVRLNRNRSRFANIDIEMTAISRPASKTLRATVTVLVETLSGT